MRRKQVSAREVMAAHLAQIERVNPKVNAIVTLVAERAMADAARADEALARGGRSGVLHGLPVAHKDLVDTAGIRTTRGSPFYRDYVPTRDALLVTRIRAAGAVTVGKTNTPEFGAGSQTFNTIFGATRNPYDLTKTCGGSSGGAAVALACGMVPIADGSDTGGSLRNPAAFCNVVGFRPSPGRVPRESSSWSPLSVSGPMARSVGDVALFLSAIAGPGSAKSVVDSRRTAPDSARRWAATSRARASRGGVDSAGSRSSRRSAGSSTANRRIFEDTRLQSSRRPNRISRASTTPLRRCATPANHPQYAPLVRERPDWVKDTIKFEVAEAEKLTAADVGRGLARQARMYDQSREFFERYDYFVLPSRRWRRLMCTMPNPTEIAGTPMSSYIDWMRSCWYITLMANPAISVPGGFTAEWTARGRPDCRAPPRRLERAAARPRVRAGGGTRAETAGAVGRGACARGARLAALAAGASAFGRRGARRLRAARGRRPPVTRSPAGARLRREGASVADGGASLRRGLAPRPRGVTSEGCFAAAA